jgi:phosphoenolpyruvate carboxykinase (ATP)
MHCSANEGQDEQGDVSLFFGLSGTGKTTLSADPAAPLIGDDEHCWTDNGVFNFEGGCYAKCINLSAEGEPEIFAPSASAPCSRTSSIDPTPREVDFADISLTENTRVTYPVEYIRTPRSPASAGTRRTSSS